MLVAGADLLKLADTDGAYEQHIQYHEQFFNIDIRRRSLG
jgi:hypothetical protein